MSALLRATRRTLTATGTALALLGLLAGPAWAAPSFTSGGEATAGDTGHTVTMQVPDHEPIGATAVVVLTAPSGFAPSGCFGPVDWGCAIEGRRVTWTRGTLGQLGTFGFQVTVPATAAGSYPFPVRQEADGGSITWGPGSGAPAMTVAGTPADGEQSPPPDDGETGSAPSDSEPPADSASEAPATGGGATEDAPASNSGSGQPPAPEPTATPAPTPDDAAAASSASSDGSDGSSAPTRTQGRSAGTTLEITPDEPQEAAAVAAPDVAEAPTDAAPLVAGDLAGDATAAGGPPGEQQGGSRPWQQVLGAALLAVGGGIVGVRRWRRR